VQTHRHIRPLALILLTLATTAAASSVGDSYDKVIAEKGNPTGQIQAGAVRILNYPDATIKLRDNVVISVKSVSAAAPEPTRAPVGPGQAPSVADEIAVAKKQLKDAIDKVIVIVNQPPPSVPRTPDLKVAWYGDTWFHPGATTPDFRNVDIRKTQDLSNYSRYAYVSSNMTANVAFPGDALEFNSMTKFFYQDRNLPKKRLTEAEMVEINRLYRVIALSEDQLSSLGGQP
jgi:hypothetical protein